MDRVTAAARAEAGGDWTAPPTAGGDDAAATAALAAMYEAIGSEIPAQATGRWSKAHENVSEVLRDYGVADLEIAEEAGRAFGRANAKTPHFVNPYLSSFPAAFGIYVGKAKKAADDAQARRARAEARNEETRAAFDERAASWLQRVEGDPAWEAAKRELALGMAKPTFDAWVRDTYGLGQDDGVYTVMAPDARVRDWLDDRLKATAQRTLVGILDEAVDVRFEVNNESTV